MWYKEVGGGGGERSFVRFVSFGRRGRRRWRKEVGRESSFPYPSPVTVMMACVLAWWMATAGIAVISSQPTKTDGDWSTRKHSCCWQGIDDGYVRLFLEIWSDGPTVSIREKASQQPQPKPAIFTTNDRSYPSSSLSFSFFNDDRLCSPTLMLMLW